MKKCGVGFANRYISCLGQTLLTSYLLLLTFYLKRAAIGRLFYIFL